MRLSRLSLTAAALIGALALAACDTPEERAESHYQRAVTLLADGEPDRAAIELRNALQANAAHVGARYEYAQLLRSQGDVQGAVGQYLRPSLQHLPVRRYYAPEEFVSLKEFALTLGFDHVESGPLVRSSYHAAEQVPARAAR